MDAKLSDGIHISSIVLGATPDDAGPVAERLGCLEGVEVHAVTPEGRMIVSVETTDERASVDTFETIRQMPGVLSASLVYHQYESDPDEEA